MSARTLDYKLRHGLSKESKRRNHMANLRSIFRGNLRKSWQTEENKGCREEYSFIHREVAKIFAKNQQCR